MATMTTTTFEELRARIEALRPLLLEYSDESERNRKLATPVLEELRESGAFRMLRPREMGGLGLTPSESFHIGEAIARADSAAAWNVQVSNASETFGGWFSDEARRELFGSPNSIVAGAFNPHRRAVVTEGGYLVSGRVPFTSNCAGATWITGLADIYDGNEMRLDDAGMPVVIMTAFPIEEAEIIDNWNVLGMSGTGSHDVAVEAVFVPEYRTAAFGPPQADASSYTKVATWATVGSFGSVALGIGQAAIDALVETGRKVPAYTEHSLRDKNVVQLRLATAMAKLGAARAQLYQTFDDGWDALESTGLVSLSLKSACQMAGTHAVMTGAEVTALVHSCAGASSIRNEQRFQRHFRDAHVLTQHAFAAEARLEAVGQIAFGLEPEWPFFAF